MDFAMPYLIQVTQDKRQGAVASVYNLSSPQVMREYTGKVDKLEEAENQRVDEAKEENNKPIVMGECSDILHHS